MNADEVADRLRKDGHFVSGDLRILPDVAAKVLIGCTPGHLANLRTRGDGPPYFRMAKIWYSIPDVLAWIAEHKVRKLDS